METEASSKDLLQRFAGSTTISDRAPPSTADAGGDLELSLGLSLGGSFSSNPREKTNKLIRSSSVSSFPFFAPKDDNFQVASTPLQRTCSLPVPGVDEDYRKRKELQTLKRLEAKRKRSEKRNSLRGEEGSGCPSHPGSRAAARGLPPVSQGSIGSLGSGSSTGGTMQGFEMIRFSKISTAKSPWTADGTNFRKSADESATIKKLEKRGSGMGEAAATEETAGTEEMPCVSTRGSGPNGKRIEGFLYKYRKGEEVRIVCVCHGSFLTPAEFVRHAGGGDVDHPLRHIVVNPPPSPF